MLGARRIKSKRPRHGIVNIHDPQFVLLDVAVHVEANESAPQAESVADDAQRVGRRQMICGDVEHRQQAHRVVQQARCYLSGGAQRERSLASIAGEVVPHPIPLPRPVGLLLLQVAAADVRQRLPAVEQVGAGFGDKAAAALRGIGRVLLRLVA